MSGIGPSFCSQDMSYDRSTIQEGSSPKITYQGMCSSPLILGNTRLVYLLWMMPQEMQIRVRFVLTAWLSEKALVGLTSPQCVQTKCCRR